MAAQKPKIQYWKPGNAVRATQVYLDANFIVAFNRPGHIWYENARALLGHFQERNTAMVLSSLALNEAIYQLLRLDEQANPAPAGEEGSNSAKALALALDDNFLNLPLLRPFEPASPAFHRQTLKAITDLGLDPTDAFHYTAARRLGCPLVSNDAGFQKIPDSHLYIVTFY